MEIQFSVMRFFVSLFFVVVVLNGITPEAVYSIYVNTGPCSLIDWNIGIGYLTTDNIQQVKVQSQLRFLSFFSTEEKLEIRTKYIRGLI